MPPNRESPYTGPVSLAEVIERVWGAIRGRQALTDPTGYGWAWRDLTKGTGEIPDDSNFLGGNAGIDDD